MLNRAPFEGEHEAVESARGNNPEAVGWLYELYFDRLYRYCYLKLGDATEAEDLVEQVFLKMIESISAFEWQGSTFAAWLYRIAHNLIIDKHRRDTRRPQVPLEPMSDTLPSEHDDPHRLAEQSDLREHLMASLANLTDLQAQVIALKFGSELSNMEVAAILNRTEGSIKSLQHSALDNLRKIMSTKGYP
ncbi:MAG: sigma-70 family RNA polymerase sigma factor [Chloroflexia bacterium]